MSTPLVLPPDEATVAAYLGNQLPEPQAEAFEIYCLDHPEFARKVELDLWFKRGLREIGIRPRTAFRFPQPWTMAASLGAVVLCGLLLLAWSYRHVGLIAYHNPGEMPLQLRTGIHFDVTLVRLRGPDATHRVVAPRGNGVLDLKIFPDTSSGQQGYTAAIRLDSGLGSRPVIVKQLRTDANGFLEVYLPLSEVVGHTLTISLASDADGAAAPAPAFQLQIAAPTE
jgi:hypothetical protein